MKLKDLPDGSIILKEIRPCSCPVCGQEIENLEVWDSHGNFQFHRCVVCKCWSHDGCMVASRHGWMYCVPCAVLKEIAGA